jgi:putative phosphoesterase
MSDYTTVAALSDIHGNIRALNAVLGEVEREQPDAIVVCGDVATGPFPGEALNRLMNLGKPAYFVRGNADRELVSAYDRQLQFDPEEKDRLRLFSSWTAQRIDKKQRDFLASFQDRVVFEVTGLGGVLFCHGSPRSDNEIITSLTPEDILGKLLAELAEKTVVCGHTHHQFDRKTDGFRVVNAGSVGMPYEGIPGAFWALLGPDVDLRKTAYDFDRLVAEALSAGYPDPSYQEIILNPPKPDEVAAFFEQVAADRGERSLP